MRDIFYALFSVAACGTNYLVAGGVDSVAMSIAIAAPPLFLMARFPPCSDAVRRLALLGLLGVAGFNLLLYSSLAYVTVVLESQATQLLEAALAWRRPSSLAAVAGAYLTLEP
jgi:drug/metabolite transporter (DMT)-like permease